MIKLKNDDFEAAVKKYIRTGHEDCDKVFFTILKNLKQCIGGDIEINSPTSNRGYRANHIGFQELEGEPSMIVGMCCENDELLPLARKYAHEDFEELDPDSYDAVCEFINVSNGVFARAKSNEGTELNLVPPTYCDDVQIDSEREFYTMPVVVEGNKITLFVTEDSNNVKFIKA